MKNIKDTKGITLIALVITIIVLIIITGVTISSAMSDHGIVEKGKQTQYEAELKIFKDNINTELLDITIKKLGKKIYGEELRDELTIRLPDYEFSVNYSNGNVVAKYKQFHYEIDRNYKLIEIIKLQETIQDFFMFDELTQTIVGINPKYLTPDKKQIIDNEILKRVVIPEKINDKQILKIGDSAFKEITNLKSIYIPEGITTIENDAFSGCALLETIVLPSTLTSLDSTTFAACNNLKQVTIPVQYSISENMSGSKDTIEEVSFVRTATQTSIADNSCNGLTKINDIEIPEGITSIGTNAFYSCTSLDTVYIPNTVTTIGSYAFYKCADLKELDLPDGLGEVSGSILSGTGIKEIILPEGVTTIKTRAFEGCEALEKIVIPTTVTTMESVAFTSCNNIREVTIPVQYSVSENMSGSKNTINKITFIRSSDQKVLVDNSCKDLTKLTEIRIPSGVTTIGNSAFYGCTSLNNVKIPNSVITVGTYAFCNCSELRILNLSYNIKQISEGMLSRSGITEIQIPSKVKTIAAKAFEGCASLQRVEIPNTVTTIDSQTFTSCNNLTIVYSGTATGSPWGANNSRVVTE